MENFTTVLWIILVGAAIFFSAVKSNEKKRKGAAKRVRRAEDSEQGQQQIPPPLPFNTPENSAARDHSAARRANFTFKTEITPEEAETTEGLAEQDEEFDLRKAVIYSEILKPKFEE